MSQVRQRSTTSTGDINILLLGQTGVGKTTFINAFANYLVYNSLDEAINGNLQAVIPAWFIFFDKDTFVEKTITIGIPNVSEKKGGVDQSCTRECHSFIFRINNRNLYLIDASDVGNIESILQNEKNFEDILAYIKLLRHLHVNAKENIMFTFTNARATFFRLYLPAPLLRELLQNLREHSNTEVPFSKENSFFFDNEAFQFLTLCKNDMEFNFEEEEDCSRSWDHSIREFSRLISSIIQRDKHATYADIVPFEYPRTLCGNEKCTKAITINGIEKVDYTNHCHPHRFLIGVEQEIIDHEKLKNCTAINKSLDKFN
ncbi:unnamed protein product [Rotaria sp. Silwood2]|nr:unnamed protein product [Rotaria sp. Silwood2]